MTPSYIEKPVHARAFVPGRSVVTLAGLMALLLFSAPPLTPAQALETHEQGMGGQISNMVKAQIDGETYGIVIAIERDVEQIPPSDLTIIPGPDPNTWKRLQLTHGPGKVATGDVTGDGNDEVAIVHHYEGEACAFPVVGELPCGVVKIYDARAMLQGELQTIAELKISPQTTSCPPSNNPPSALSLVDVTGNGRAELAIGQLGLQENSCGVVHVFAGDQLEGDLTLSDACARVRGPQTPPGGQPDNFGIHVELFASNDPQTGFLAIGAPYTSTPDVAFAGRLAVHDLTAPCTTQTGQGPITPPLAFERHGTVEGQLVGVDTAYTPDSLWIASKGFILNYHVPAFQEAPAYAIQRTYPLNVAGDLTGDGRPELIAGPFVINLDGELVLHFTPFAAETFRGAILSDDHALSSDRFGMRMWSLTDLWNPSFTLAHNSPDVYAGGTVKVYLDDLIALAPVSEPLEWHVTGGTLLERNNTEILVRADEPGQIVVQATLKQTRATIQIPVQALEDHALIQGPDTAAPGQSLTLRTQVPTNATVAWEAPGGEPASGTGTRIETMFTETGDHRITAQVTMPDGATTTLEHFVRVLHGTLELDGPTRIPQGERLEMRVQDPDPDHTHTWHLESGHMGVINLTGPSIQIPTAGWGPLNVTVAAKLDTGEAVDVGHTRLEIENLPPRIRSFQIDAETISYGFEASVQADDPGGDPFTIHWLLDDREIGTGPAIQVTGLDPGPVNLTIEATDAGGLTTSQTRTVEIKDPWRTIENDPNQTTDLRTDPRDQLPDFDDIQNASSSPADPEGDERTTPAPPATVVVMLVVVLVRALKSNRKVA